MAIKQVRVKINNTWTVLTYNEATGKYEGTVAAPNITSYNVNADHYYPVTVEATNMADTKTTVDDTNASIGNSLKLFVKEVTPPVITITAPTAAAFLNSNTPSISFNIVDENNGSGVSITSLRFKIDNGPELTNTSPGVTVTSITNGYSITYVPQSALSDGNHTVTVNCSDNDGNPAVQKSISFTVDTIPPVLSITAPASDGLYVSNSSFVVTGSTSDTTSGTVTVTVKLNGVDQGAVAVNGDGSFSKSINLANGLNTIVIRSTDKAGKYTEITRTITLDTSAPTITGVSISPNPVNVGNSYIISVTVN